MTLVFVLPVADEVIAADDGVTGRTPDQKRLRRVFGQLLRHECHRSGESALVVHQILDESFFDFCEAVISVVVGVGRPQVLTQMDGQFFQ